MMRIHLSPPHSSGAELALLEKAIRSNWVAPVGPFIEEFERAVGAYVDGMFATALSSGTAALHLALIGVGIGPGQEVLVPSLTVAATANVVKYVGARPVFVDVDAGTWQINPNLVADELDRRARKGTLPAALITVDLYGQCCDYELLEPLCAQYGIPLIEDAAEALGASDRGRRAGSFGRCAALSFNGNKIITTSGGGMLLSSDPALTERARFLAMQAREPLPHYEHTVVGYNYRLSNLLAAVGVAQMSVLDQRVNARRRINATYRQYLSGLPGVEFMAEAGHGRSTWWLTCITIDPRKAKADAGEVTRRLIERGIEARPVFKPLHLQPVFAGSQVVGGAVAEDIFTRGICLPSGSNLTLDEQEEIIDLITSCVLARAVA